MSKLKEIISETFALNLLFSKFEFVSDFSDFPRACQTTEMRYTLFLFRKGGESLRVKARGGKSELHKARCRATCFRVGYARAAGFKARRRIVPQRTYRHGVLRRGKGEKVE